ncbi:MAG: D-alanyl-D-alanine carboxypeptidase [Solirubrobacterales bacterium]|nr:D-alanyl-D-alanine carboxypeptidase [Solirubrobacterales bacterium]
MPRPRPIALLATVAALGLSGCDAGNADLPVDEGAGAAAQIARAQQDALEAKAGAPVVQAEADGSPSLQVANGPVAPSIPPTPLAVKLDDISDPVVAKFDKPPRAGLLFDLDTGEVLWRRNALRRLPIASVTKTMTALIAAREIEPGTRIRISRRARGRPGSRIGILPKKRTVGVSALLNGLMLVSGNDAAVALAEEVSGSVEDFVALMNETAQEMRLSCTSFASPDGLDDTGYSCPQDLAALARAALDEPRVAEIVKRPRAVLPFPTKGGKLYLYTHNPLLKAAYRGTLGIKTGYTRTAGRCFLGAAERDGRRLGVVLLHSPNPGRQAQVLLNRGWRATS